MSKKIDKLCKYMRNLRDGYAAARSSDFNDIDMKIALKARVDLLEDLLQEAAFIKKEKKKELNLELEDVGC